MQYGMAQCDITVQYDRKNGIVQYDKVFFSMERYEGTNNFPIPNDTKCSYKCYSLGLYLSPLPDQAC